MELGLAVSVERWLPPICRPGAANGQQVPRLRVVSLRYGDDGSPRHDVNWDPAGVVAPAVASARCIELG